MRLTRLIAALATIPLLLSAFALRGEDPKPKAAKAADDDATEVTEDDANKWMKVKLKASQEIFAGLTNGDAKAIEVNSRRMLLINVLEQWKQDNEFTQQSDYDAQLNAFEFATKELVRTAKDDDIDGALEAYVLLSKSCVKCHQLIRDVPGKKEAVRSR